MMHDWCFYSKEILCEKLGLVDWSNNADNVQEAWNYFENKLVNVVDFLVPIKDF